MTDDDDRTVRAPADLDEATRVDPVKPASEEEDDPTKVVARRLGTYSQAHAALKYKPKPKDDDDGEERSIIVRAARKVRKPVPLSLLVLVLLALAFMVVRLLRDTYGW